MPIKDISANPDKSTHWCDTCRGGFRARGLFFPRHLGLPDEAFVLAPAPEEARAVEARNDPAAAAVKANRQRYVLDNGVVQEAELPDINAALEREVRAQAVGSVANLPEAGQ
jgi:hypothetical protein